MHKFIPFMTVDRRQNPDRTLVRGTRISSCRKLQCYKCYKCVKQLIVRVGCEKGKEWLRVIVLFFGLLSFTSLWRLTHARTQTSCQGKWGKETGSVSGWSVDGREVDRVISRISGGTSPRPDGYFRPPLTRLGLIRVYWPDQGKVWGDCQVGSFSLLDIFNVTKFSWFTWPSLPGRSQLKANERISHWTGDCRWNTKYFFFFYFHCTIVCTILLYKE